MSRKFQRWIRSRAGMATLVTVLAIVIIAAVWYGLTATPGTVILQIPETAEWPEPGGGYTCLPTCDTTDGRFLIMASDGRDTFAAEPMVFWFGFTRTQSEIEIHIFDGDTGGVSGDGAIRPHLGHWDRGTAESTYTLYADPLKDGQGMTQVGQWRGNADNMPDNDWFIIALDEHHPEAQSPSGHYYYRFEVTHPFEETGSFNAFKLRTTGYLSSGLADRVSSTLGLVGAVATFNDIAILYPGWTPGEPINSYASTYTGEWLFNFYLPNSIETLELWDGDFDHGSWDGSTVDIDDPVTGTGYIPEWAQSPSVRPQGAQGIGSPPDLNRTYFGREPSVIYRVIDPDGDPVHVNTNPSGSEEWQRFVISTNPDMLAHSYVDEIKPGLYGWHIVGLDLHNAVWIRTTYEIVGECADPDNCELPPPVFHEGACPRTIGYWKNNVWRVLIQDRTRGVQETRESIEEALDNVALTSPLFRNGINVDQPVAIETVTRLTDDEAHAILQSRQPPSMLDRALQQNLAAWLNVGSGKLGPTTVVVLNVAGGTFEGTVMEALEEAQAIILNPDSSNAELERAKDIADQMNNGLLGEEADGSSCEDYEAVMPPDKQPPGRKNMPQAPKPPTPPNPTPIPEPDPETCPNLRVNQYTVENTTNNPFYGIKFEYQSGTEVKDGQFDEFRFTVSADEAAAMNDSGIQLEAKAATFQGFALMTECEFDLDLACSDFVRDEDNHFTFYFDGAIDNGDGTLTLRFRVQNLTGHGLSHVTFGLPDSVQPSWPTNNYQSEVCQ